MNINDLPDFLLILFLVLITGTILNYTQLVISCRKSLNIQINFTGKTTFVRFSRG